jgi:hypothetical protein
MKRRISAEKREAHKWDQWAAYKLLTGVYQLDENGRLSFHCLSSNTDPTEKEARAALSRVLLSDEVPRWLLGLLALLFNPEALKGLKTNFELVDPAHQRKVVFKKLSKGHSMPLIDRSIAVHVQYLRLHGHSYEKAIKAAEEKYELDQRHIKRIYSKHKNTLTPLREAG